MAKRFGLSKHYEMLFEQMLRYAGILYLAIDESKRPIYDKSKIKNFDFIVSSFNGKYLIDIKGKKLDYGKGQKLENWIHKDDISGLKLWATHFNAFIPLLVFVYQYSKKTKCALFDEYTDYKGKRYSIMAITLADYYTTAKTRSRQFGAIYVSSEDFKNKLKPISHFIPELRKNW
jgi:hypothetical protein